MLVEVVVALIILLLCGGVSYVYGIHAHITLILFPQITQLSITQAFFSGYFIEWCWNRQPVAAFIVIAILVPSLMLIRVLLRLKDDE